MCFGGDSKDDPYWWGYIDDGQGWTARRKSEYMKTPAYNKELRGKGYKTYRPVEKMPDSEPATAPVPRQMCAKTARGGRGLMI